MPSRRIKRGDGCFSVNMTVPRPDGTRSAVADVVERPLHPASQSLTVRVASRIGAP